MNNESIQVAIEKYVKERMEQGRKRAVEHFLAYAYLKHGGGEIREFMRKSRGLARYYMHYLHVMENPFRGPEVAVFGVMVLVAIYSCYLMGIEDNRPLGIIVFAGTVAHFCGLVRLVAKKWSETGVMIAIYREIAEMAEDEMR